MRPRIKPGLRVVERDEHTVQVGLHPGRRVLIGDGDGATVPVGRFTERVRRWLLGLDGTRDLEGVLRAAAGARLDAGQARELVGRLFECGVLDDVPGVVGADLSLAERDRLRPELDAVALGAGDGGHAAFERRRGAHVRVHGAGRVGAQVVALLAAAGVGRISVTDPGPARPEDITPGGLGWQEVGGRRDAGAVAVALRVAGGGAFARDGAGQSSGASQPGQRPGEVAPSPKSRARSRDLGKPTPIHEPGTPVPLRAPSVTAWVAGGQVSDGSQLPDLVVLAPVTPLDGLLIRDLLAWRVPHLLAEAYEEHGGVGPLVVPGVTPCLHCLDLARRDADPGSPIVSARVGGSSPGEFSCSTALATQVAAAVAGHALAFLEGRETPVTNATMGILPDWRMKWRSVTFHEQCRCFRNNPGSLTMVESTLCG